MLGLKVKDKITNKEMEEEGYDRVSDKIKIIEIRFHIIYLIMEKRR